MGRTGNCCLYFTTFMVHELTSSSSDMKIRVVSILENFGETFPTVAIGLDGANARHVAGRVAIAPITILLSFIILFYSRLGKIIYSMCYETLEAKSVSKRNLLCTWNMLDMHR